MQTPDTIEGSQPSTTGLVQVIACSNNSYRVLGSVMMDISLTCIKTNVLELFNNPYRFIGTVKYQDHTSNHDTIH